MPSLAILKLYWPFIRAQWGKVLGIIILNFLIIGITAVVYPYIYKEIFDSVEKGVGNVSSEYVVGVAVILLIAVILRQAVFGRLWGYLYSLILNIASIDMNNYFFAEISKKSFSFFVNEPAGAINARATRFGSGFESALHYFLNAFMDNVLVVLFALIVLSFEYPPFAFAMGVWALIYLSFSFATAGHQRRLNLERGKANTRYGAVLIDTLSNMHTVKMFGAEHTEGEAYARVGSEIQKIRFRAWLNQIKVRTIQSVLTATFQGGMMVAVVYLWTIGEVSAGMIALIQWYLMRVTDGVSQLGQESIKFQQAMNEVEEARELLERPVEIADKTGARELVVRSGSIQFDDVSFMYEKGGEVFKNLSFAIAPGERVGIVGHSGAGKTTITKLLLRFLDVQTGSISIDDADIRDVTQESLRKQIAYVPQEPLLFHRSLLENIRYGRPDASDEEVVAAAVAARVDIFAQKLPQKYDTLVGEKGIKLSGGERQRVALARVILKAAPILVLDEATSALDTHSEHYIQEALNEAMKGRTTLVIAHRLSTIRHLDRIIVFENGKILEEGPHDALLEKGGTYQSLWNSQSGGFLGE